MEFTGVVGDDGAVFSHGVGGDQQVHGAHGLAGALQRSAHLRVMVGGLQRPGPHVKAGEPGLDRSAEPGRCEFDRTEAQLGCHDGGQPQLSMVERGKALDHAGRVAAQDVAADVGVERAAHEDANQVQSRSCAGGSMRSARKSAGKASVAA